MTKAVLFDLDGTLLDRDTTVELYLRSLYLRLNLHHVAYESFRNRFRELDQHGYADKDSVFRQVAMEFRLPVSVQGLVADFRMNAWKDCMTYPDSRTVLEQLRSQGYALGIITNGSSESQRAKLLASGLSTLVEVSLVSAEEGVRKPDPDIFVRAAWRLSIDTVDCVFVGDNPRTDVVGAHEAGMRTAWLRRHVPWPDDISIVPDYTVSALTELLAIRL